MRRILLTLALAASGAAARTDAAQASPATGVDDVWVSGVRALERGVATNAPSGRFVHGRAWTGAPGGGCRASSHDWTWTP